MSLWSRPSPDLSDDDAFVALRAAILEPEIGDDFTRTILRRNRLECAKVRWRYWMPAAVGASIAVVALTLMLQLLTVAGPTGGRDLGAAEARRSETTVIFPTSTMR